MENYTSVISLRRVGNGLPDGLRTDYARRRMPESKRRKPKQRPPSQKAIEAAAKAKDPSPTWYVALMAGLMVAGVILVLIRFIFAETLSQIWLLAGLAAIAAGFVMTTNYR